MEQKYVNHLHSSFALLVAEHGFVLSDETNSGDTYFVEYKSTVFGIKIEKYRREFYLTLYKSDAPDVEIELFNLLSYLNQNGRQVHKPIILKKEIDPYRRQLTRLAETLLKNFNDVDAFFVDDGSFEKRVSELRNYVIKRNPDLFGRKN